MMCVGCVWVFRKSSQFSSAYGQFSVCMYVCVWEHVCARKMFSSQMSELTFSPLASANEIQSRTHPKSKLSHTVKIYTHHVHHAMNDEKTHSKKINRRHIARFVCHSVCKRFFFLHFVRAFFSRMSREYLARIRACACCVYSFCSFSFPFEYVHRAVWFILLFGLCSFFIFLLRIVIGAGWRAPLLL